MKRALIVIILINNCFSTQSQSITGNWEGNLNVPGNSLPIIFHIKIDSTGKLSATFDSPKQKAFNLACSDVVLQADSVLILMKLLNGQYTGKLSADHKNLTGFWQQGAASLPLTLDKITNTATVNALKRPQTPKAPFTYFTEEVSFNNADKSIQFGGTFTAPKPDSNIRYIKAPVYPTVLLITGSGPQDRDETLFEHKPFAIIADHLTKKGFGVLRVDDRGTGKTTGNFSQSTSADFAKDVEAAIDYLKTRREVDTNKIGLLGHSEGGMIAPMVAAKSATVKYIVLLAAPGLKITKLMEQQSIDVAAAAGTSMNELEQYRPLYSNIVKTVLATKDATKAKLQGIAVFKKWQKNKPASLVKNTTGVTDNKSMADYISTFVTTLQSPWFNYFMRFDPAIYLSKLTCPVLALNGKKDIQVAAEANLAAIASALKKGKNIHFSAKALPGLNHLFQHCNTCAVDEYGTLEESFSTEALTLISDWLATTIK